MNALTATTELLTATALSGGVGSIWLPEEGSTLAPMVDWIYNTITLICVFFFVLIVILMGVFMYRYRRRNPSDPAPRGPTHHTALELTWTIIPLILVIAIFYIGMRGYLNMSQVPAGAYEVYATAQKWAWSFQHRNGASGPILDVPAGRPVKVILTSSDVLHAFYVPAFRVKADVVPGRVRTVWFEVPDTSTEIREFDLFCAEYCGTGHSDMITRVRVVPADQWDDYIEEQANIADKLTDEQLPCYAAVRIYPRCASCHSLDGSTGTGPSYKGLWESIASGETIFTSGEKLADIMGPGKTYENPEDYVMQSITNPQKHIVENFTGAMPTFQGQLKPREIQAMIMFLKDPYAVVDEKGKLKVECNF